MKERIIIMRTTVLIQLNTKINTQAYSRNMFSSVRPCFDNALISGLTESYKELKDWNLESPP